MCNPDVKDMSWSTLSTIDIAQWNIHWHIPTQRCQLHIPRLRCQLQQMSFSLFHGDFPIHWPSYCYYCCIPRCMKTYHNKKLCCRREAARCFVFVCSRLQHTYSAVFFIRLLVTAASDLLLHKINFENIFVLAQFTNVTDGQTPHDDIGRPYASHRAAKTRMVVLPDVEKTCVTV